MLKEKCSLLLPYGVAAVAAVLAMVLTAVLWPLLKPSVPSLFFAAVMVSAWYGGLGPGLLATALAAVAIEYFFLPPPTTPIDAVDDFLLLGVFVLVALLISSLTAARKRAEEALRRAHDGLEVRVQERTAELAKANEALRAEISERKRAEEEKQKLVHNLRERVKELTALHKTARLLQDEQKLTAELLQEITALLPSAWQHSERAAARILFNGTEYVTPLFSLTPWEQQADFTMPGGKQGLVQVVYLEKMPQEVEGPFLTEERSLLDSVAEMLKSYFERKEAETRVAQVTQELIERNQELWRLQREMGRVEPLAALGRITGTIAHELGTPLNSVLGYSQLLAQEELSESARDSLRIIETQVQRMVDIIQHYLSHTRRALSTHRPININELIRETLVLLKPIFQQHRVGVTTTLAESLPPLSGDSASLQRVLINLLNNAVDALEEGGMVTILTRESGPPETDRSGVTIEVSDTGSGIPPELLPRIFDLFETTKAPGKGTGLGLAICQEIVKGHSGTIEINSQVGQGTCIRIFLPADERVVTALTPRDNDECTDSDYR
jgi:signal transduction histidine kinase